jgi:hypothetical protein
MDPVQVSNPLDLTSTVPAPPIELADQTCLGLGYGGDLGRG